LEGNVRKYFGLTPAEVFSTGSSNTPKKIPDTPWWVSTNNDGGRKAEIVYNLVT
jgi:negative regulator of replication initiation